MTTDFGSKIISLEMSKVRSLKISFPVVYPYAFLETGSFDSFDLVAVVH
jgi:hypothetical protein